MGSVFKIIAYHTDSLETNKAVEAAFARIETLNLALSDYSELSETWKLNSNHQKQDSLIKVSDDLWDALVLSKQVANDTERAFDPTIGSLVRLWRRARRQNTLPDSIALENARKSSGFDKIRLVDSLQSILISNSNLNLDFGGIGKGIAADEAMKVLQSHGIKSALIDASGDMLASDPPPGKSYWVVEFEDDNSMSQVLIQNAAIATSGDLYQYVEIDGVRYSHIVDPATGIALRDQSQATVIHRTAALADAYASAFCVLPVEKSLKLANESEVIETKIWKKEQNKTHASSDGFVRYVIP
ncbi:MAG: FAD:protein FMN transferase [Cyclobacteriaceae bacterium]